MLRKAATTEGKDWDKLIPYLLFAYREVPQASTGFSPFDLMYDRSARGPLDILREKWEAGKQSDESVVSYVLSVREKIEKMKDIVHENLTTAQDRQKKWYDKRAREREFKMGDQVLVMLPTETNKLLAHWQGPYTVIKRMGRVNYKIDMSDLKKRKRTFHVNMLRKFHSPEFAGYTEGMDEFDEEELATWNHKMDEKPKVSDQLTNDQSEDLKMLITEFPEVWSGTPSKTDKMEHNIMTGTAKPIRLPAYRLPHAYRDEVKKELDEMLRNGVIEPSNSEWSAPIVLVPKKDGSLRICVDYR